MIAAARQGRALPHNLEAERAVLGLVLFHRPAIAEVLDLVGAKEFYHPAHAAVFAAMVALDDASSPIDSIAVTEEMRRQDTADKLRAVNGEAYFAELLAEATSPDTIRYHARLIADCAARRRAMEAAAEAQTVALAGDDGWADRVEELVFKSLQRRDPETAVPSSVFIRGVLAEIEKRSEAPRETVGLTTGYAQLDRIIRGWRAPRLHVLAGHPGDGKSALALNCALHVALRLGEPVYGFSPEMDETEQGYRMLACEGHLDADALTMGRLETQTQWVQLSGAASRLHAAPITIDRDPRPTLRQIRARARRWRSRHRPGQTGLLLIDYLQLCEMEQRKGENDAAAIGRMTRGLKQLAGELRSPILLLSQLNREADKGERRKPRPSDLRGSGSIEQDADVVLFLWAKERLPDDQPTDLLVAKQRGGAGIGSVPLLFRKSQIRFEERGDEERYIPPPASGSHRHPYATEDDR